MRLGIVGLPQSGKTTIFNALTRGTQPTGTVTGKIEVHEAVVDVPDDRVDKLAEMFNPKKTIYAKVTYDDISGLDGSSKSGISGELLNKLAQMDGFIHVVRCFENENVVHPNGSIDPLREPMVSADRTMNGLMGVQPETQMIGGNRTSDELPTAESADGEAKPTHEHNVSAPESGARAANLEDQITDGVYVTDGACYTLYYFDDDATHEYAGVINDAAKLLGDEATVYSVLIPTNAGVMLDDQTLKDLGVPNQGQAIDYFYSLMSDDVVTVPTYDTLREHKDEYLYFRTDHHWTQLGAYYVYESFCKVKGIEPAPFFEWETLVFEPFWGEYDGVADLASFKPDSVEAHIPQGTNTMTYWVDDLDPSSKMEGPIVADLSDLDDDNANKYNCFVCGNRPMSYIENPNVTDGSSCLVIKDSFGNPFVATLVDSYQYIYTLDFRFTSQKLLDIVREHDIDDVIFENVIMFAGTYDAVDLLSSIVYPDEPAADEGGSEAADGTAAAGEPVDADATENETAESTA